MTYSLGVSERLQLLNILPAQGDILTLRIVSDLRTALSFSEEETEQLKIRQEGDQIRWDVTAELPKDVQFGSRATELVCQTLKKLSGDGKLHLAYVPLYDLFVGE